MSKKALIVIVSVLIVLVLVIYFVTMNKSNPQNTNDKPAMSSFEIEGMKVEILRNGTGNGAKAGDYVTTHYVGTLQDGIEFDSSIARNTPFAFQLGQNRVIKGWDLGVEGMKIGEERRLTIPYELAYGPDGFPPKIPEKATLTFVITMLSINPPPPTN